MLSAVLHSQRAIAVNMAIMRAFVKLREVMTTHKDLAHKIDVLERKYTDHEEDIQVIFKAIRQLLEPPPLPAKNRIGFHTGDNQDEGEEQKDKEENARTIPEHPRGENGRNSTT